MRIEKWLADRSSRVRLSTSAGIGLGVASGLLVVLQARMLALIADDVIFRHLPVAQLLPFFLALAGAILARSLAAWGSERASFASGAAMKLALRGELFRRIPAIGPVALSGEGSGGIAAAAIEGVEAIEVYYTRYVPQRAVSAVLPLAVLAFIIPLDLFSTIVLASTALVIPVLMILIGEGAEALSRQQWDALQRMSARLLDTLQGLTTLKLFGASRREAALIANLSDTYRVASMVVLRVSFLSAFALELFSTISIAVVAVSIGLRLMEGTIQFLPGYFILLLAPELFLPLRSLGGAWHARMNAMAAAEKIAAILGVETPPGPGGIRLAASAVPPAPFSVSFDNVSFSYSDGPAVLNGISLALEPGRRIALMGESGAGKSTLISLLLRFTEPTGGSIRVNAANLGDLSLEQWRARVGWMPQRPWLFQGTIMDNIRLGRPDATLDLVVEAAVHANAHAFISALPAGYSTMVGERGAGLSGGQIQRIALARVFLKDAPLILLDEPGAHVDAESGRLISAGIDACARGKTLLTVAHRIPSVASADEILVLDGGRIAERGTRAELLRAGGVFARMAAASGGPA